MRFNEVMEELESKIFEFSETTTAITERGGMPTPEELYILAEGSKEVGELFLQLSEETAKAGLIVRQLGL